MSYQGTTDQRYGHITYSHCGEDLMVCNLFELMGIEKPSYLDIGAHHPFHISNTALLYSRGSRGVNVEANPTLIGEFKTHRPDDININIGIATKPGIMPFYQWDNRSGRNTFSKEWADKLEVRGETIDLPVTTIDNIVTKYCGGRWPDFLTMDIEGLDYEVLESANFSRNPPKIICVEAWPKDGDKFKRMLFGKGYYAHSRHSVDLIFVLNDYMKKVN